MLSRPGWQPLTIDSKWCRGFSTFPKRSWCLFFAATLQLAFNVMYSPHHVLVAA
jgi:hypothetical protein